MVENDKAPQTLEEMDDDPFSILMAHHFYKDHCDEYRKADDKITNEKRRLWWPGRFIEQLGFVLVVMLRSGIRWS